jgi:uncharacterized peroxidase-related enzyme
MKEEPAMSEAALLDPPIPFVDPGTLDDESRARLGGMAAMLGFEPASMKTYFHRPAIAGAIMGLMGAVFQDKASTLPAALKGKLGIVCSAINGCSYCVSHQCHAGGHSDAALQALANGQDKGGDPIEHACLAYARAASFDPASVGLAMLEEIKAVLTPPQIVELAAVVGMWKMINTIHDTLHLPVEQGLPDAAGLIAAARA